MNGTVLKELKKKLVRPASRAIVGGFRPPADPLASWLGRVNIAVIGAKNRRVEAGGYEQCPL